MARELTIFFLISATALLAFAPTGTVSFGPEAPNYSTTPPITKTWTAAVDLTKETGVVWNGTWNVTTGLPHRLMSDGLDFPIKDSADVIEKCLDFTREYPELFGNIDPSSLEPLVVRKRLGIWYVTFQQTFDGIIVEGARADFRIKAGKLTMFGADVLPDLLPENPVLDSRQAVKSTSRRFNFDNSSAKLVRYAPSGGKLAWRIIGEKDNPRQRWVCYIDAISGELLAAYDDIRTSVSGTVYGKLHPLNGNDSPRMFSLEHLFVGEEGIVSDTTDTAGYYETDIVPGSGWHLSATLEGLFVKAIIVGGGSAELWVEADSSIVDLYFAPPDAALDETGAYYHSNVVHDWVKTLDPEFTGMDYSVKCYVRETRSPCPNNAFWDGEAIHMGAGSAMVDNFAYYADVLYHEYGHGITHHQYPGWSLPYTGESGAIDEACSDYTACTITGDPELGEGGLTMTGPLRTMDNNLMYPDDIVGEVHQDGAIIGGCFWDLRGLVGNTWADTLIHFAKYGLPTDFESFLDEILLVDDDDGNILNGTPNFMDIYTAFQNHGIGRFKVNIYHRPLSDTEDSLGPYGVDCIVTSTLPIDTSSIMLIYSTNSGIDWDTVSVYSTGTPYEYSGEIAGVAYGTVVDYYLSACDTLGICSTLPDSAPQYYYTFAVGTDTIPPVITHRPMPDVAVPAAPYQIDFTVNDNLGISRVMFTWMLNGVFGDSFGISPDSLGYCTALIDTTGLAVGDSIGYKIVATDGARSPNSTSFPDDDYYYFHIVRSSWLDFEMSDGGFVSDSGWEWGVPGTGIGTHSGDNVWGTLLTEDYENNANYVLETGDFDLSTWHAGVLELWTFYKAEVLFDGGQIYVSSDGGNNWEMLIPVGGYPISPVTALSGPGFSGDSYGWVKYNFDLTPFLIWSSGVLRFKFVFKSDPGLQAPGWFIDDFAILERQIILPPGRLIAESGWDRSVRLHWKLPDPEAASEGRARPMAFTGYNVYRTEYPDSFGSVPVNVAPVPGTLYVDTGLVNEETYYYRVTSVFAEGESDPTQVQEATPFNATASVIPDSIYIEVAESSAAIDTTITIANLGGGWLDFEVVEYNCRPARRRSRPVQSSENPDLYSLLKQMADAGLLDDYSEPPPTVEPVPTNWRHLAHDPDEPAETKDIKDVWGQHDTNHVWMKMDSWSNMGDPYEDFIVGFGFDVDLNDTTGSPVYWGTEYLAAAGKLPFPDVYGILLRYNPSNWFGWDLAGVPHWMFLTPDSVGFGFFLDSIDSPPAVFVHTAVFDLNVGIFDHAPDDGDPPVRYVLTDAWWISEDPITGTALASSPQEVNVHVDIPSMPPGEYYVWLNFETNDRSEPEHTVPVVCIVNPTGIEETSKPVALSLGEPYPNPFNARCRLKFSVPGGRTQLEIFDICGRKATTIHSGELPAGYYTAYFDGTNNSGGQLPTGVYFARLLCNGKTVVRKMLLVK